MAATKAVGKKGPRKTKTLEERGIDMSNVRINPEFAQRLLEHSENYSRACDRADSERAVLKDMRSEKRNLERLIVLIEENEYLCRHIDIKVYKKQLTDNEHHQSHMTREASVAIELERRTGKAFRDECKK